MNESNHWENGYVVLPNNFGADLPDWKMTAVLLKIMTFHYTPEKTLSARYVAKISGCSADYALKCLKVFEKLKYLRKVKTSRDGGIYQINKIFAMSKKSIENPQDGRQCTCDGRQCTCDGRQCTCDGRQCTCDGQKNKINNKNNISTSFAHEEENIKSITHNDIENNQSNSSKEKHKNITPSDVVQLWNDKNQKEGNPLQSIKLLTESRKKKINTASKTTLKSQKDWVEYIDTIFKSDWLIGKVKDWRCSFDWCLESKNMVKIIEGNYSSQEQKDEERILALKQNFLEKYGDGLF
jgi:hypothetical protein